MSLPLVLDAGRAESRPSRLAGHDLLPFLLGLLFFLVSAGFAVAQHLTFHTRARDMGIYVQILWNAAQGRPFISTLLQENTNHLAEHVAPLLWPLLPLAGLAPDAVPLVIIQQAALAACGIPIWIVARARVGYWPALGVLLCFYLMPAVSRVSLSEFHPVVVAALPVAAGVAAALQGRPRSAVLLVLLALLFEEEVGPTAIGVALLLALQCRGVRGSARRSLTLPLTLLAVAVVWTLLTVFVVMPGYRLRATRGDVSNRTASHYDQVLQNPAIVGQWIAVERGPDVLASLLLPTGGVALLAPLVLAVDLPSLVVLFLQDRAGSYAGHWSAPLLPVIWLATAVGLGRLARCGFWSVNGLKGSYLAIGLALMLGGTVLAYPLDSYFPGGREFEADHYYPTDVEADLRQAVDRVTPDASLVATRRVVPHLAARRDLYQFPFTFYAAPLRPDSQRQDFYILDLTDSPSRQAVDVGESDSVLEKRPRYHVVRFGPEVLLLTKARPEPAEPRGEVFGGAVRLLGLDWPDGSPGRWVGDPLTVRLYWDSPRRPEAEPTRLLRLLGPDGRAVAESVGRPVDDYLPVRDWDRNQVVAEELTLQPVPPTRPGVYRLVVGWRFDDGRPLLLDGSGAPELELARLQRG